MDRCAYESLVAKFRKLIADHGTFRVCQLYEYVELQTRVRLTSSQRGGVLAVAVEQGAIYQKFDGLKHARDPQLYKFPVKTRRGLPNRKRDTLTIDMFGGK